MIKIFTAADANYLTQVGALLLSLQDSQKTKFELTVVGDNWDQKSINKIESIKLNNVDLKFKSINKSDFEAIRLSHGFPLATAYNLIGPKYLFSTYEKIIYLDADMLVVGDLTKVWELEFTETVAAVSDSHIGLIGNPSMWRPWRETNSNPLAKYLNTGFMVINIKKWNDAQITERCFELLEKFEMPCIDQDALSLVLNGNYHSLHPMFNLMPYHMMPKLRHVDFVESVDEIESAILNPIVIHFHRSFFGKPWNVGCTHPYVMLWRKFANRANSNWKKKFVFMDIIKGKVARTIGMSDLDPVLENLKV